MGRPVRLEVSENSLGHTSQHPIGACENFTCSLKFLANQQLGGDGLVQVPEEGLQERSKVNTMDELKRSITVDNREAVKVGDLEKESLVFLIVDPKFSVDCLDAAVLEGAEELTHRRGEECGLRTFIDTTNVGDSRWGPPLVDEDRQRRVGKDACKYVEIGRAVNIRHPSTCHKANTPWGTREAEAKREDCDDQGSGADKLKSCGSAASDMEKHLQSPSVSSRRGPEGTGRVFCCGWERDFDVLSC